MNLRARICLFRDRVVSLPTVARRMPPRQEHAQNCYPESLRGCAAYKLDVVPRDLQFIFAHEHVRRQQDMLEEPPYKQPS